MNNNLTKVSNTSDYWYYNDEKDKVWWFFKNFQNIDVVSEFYEKYHLLTIKYKILSCFNLSYVSNLSDFYKVSERKLVFPSLLFIKKGNKIKKEVIIDVNELYGLDHYEIANSSYHYNEPINIVEFGKKENNKYLNDIYIYIKSDVFFQSLFNRKTYRSVNDLIKINGIDNSELVYLNTPRFNSFFRDFKNLCFSYGAEFSYEIDIYETEDLVSPEGIFIDGEVIYYEDIVDMLDEEYRIVDLSINTDFSSKKVNNTKKIMLEEESELKEELEKIMTKNEGFESKDNIIFSMDYQETINQFIKDNNLRGWQQFYENFISNSFVMNNDEYLAYLQDIRCPFGFIGTASKIKKIYNIIEKLVPKNADKELIQTLAIICSGSFLEQRNIKCEKWLNSNEWLDFNNNEEFSIIDMLELYENANTYIKIKVMSMPIFKIF